MAAQSTIGRRTLHPHGRSARTSWTAAGVGALALAVILAPAASAASYGPPFRGAVSKVINLSLSGCETAHVRSAFSLTTGLAAGSLASSGKTCAKKVGSVGSSSSAIVGAGEQAGIHFRPGGGFRHVAADWSFHVQLKGAESAGLVCPPAPPFSNSFAYQSGGSFYWYNTSGANQYCDAYTSSFVSITSYVDDLTTGALLNYSYQMVAGSLIDTSNSTFWYCFNNTIYNGSAYSYSHGCSGYNQTTTTFASFGGVFYPVWGGATSFNNTTAGASTIWYNNTYHPTHQYVLYFELDLATDASVIGWAHANSSASLDMATHGNYGQLVKIVAT